MPSGGFIAVRRGLLEHLRRGKLTELEALTFIIILGLANPHTGIWWGSAKSLWGEYPFYGNERRARRALEGLASKWYIKRLSTPGKHSNYPILIDKYEVKVGEKVGLRLNARKSRNERSLCYEKNGTRRGDGELGVIHDGELVVKDVVFTGMPTPPKAASSPPLLKKEKETEKEKKKETPPASPAFRALTDWLVKTFQETIGKKPTWVKKDYVALAKLKKDNPSLEDLEIKRRFVDYLDSTTQFFVGWQLGKFCNYFDSFIEGPVIRPLTQDEIAQRDARVGRGPR